MESAALKAGISTTAFQELTYAAKQSGIESGGLDNALVRMNRSLSLASTGGKQQTDTLRALGLTFKELEGLSPDKQFEILAEQINKLPNAADKARAEITLFGRAGGEMGILIAKGAKGIEELRKQAETLGGVMSEETIKNLEEAHKSIDRLETSFSTLASTLIGKVAPAFSNFLDQVTRAIAGDKTSPAALKEQLDIVNEQINANPNLGSRDQFMASLLARRQQLQSAQNLQTLTAGAVTTDVPQLGGAPGFDATKLDKQLDFINVTLKKKFPLQEFASQTRGLEATLVRDYQETIAKIQAATELATDKGGITQEEANRRIKDAKDKFDAAFDQVHFVDVSLTKLFPVTELHKAIDEFTSTMQQAFENTAHQSGNFGKNLLRNILTALEDRAIFNAIAEIGAAMHDALLGKTDATGSTGQGGFSGGLLMAIGGFFGARASGGMVSGGQSYLVGEKGPELFTPDTSGYVSANGAGGMMFAPTYNIVAPNGDQQLRAALPGLLRATAARTKQDMLDAFRRNNLRAPSRA